MNRIIDKLHFHSGLVESYVSIFKLVDAVKPDECYHLAAQSFVNYSLEDESFTLHVNIDGTHYILSALIERAPKCKLYFAGSSEKFGRCSESPQNENTIFPPRSLYGIFKTTGFYLTRNYLEAHNMFAHTEILFNLESTRRDMNL